MCEMGEEFELFGFKFVFPEEWHIDIVKKGGKYRFRYIEIFKKDYEKAAEDTIKLINLLGFSLPIEKKIEGDKLIMKLEADLPLEEIANFVVAEFLPHMRLCKRKFSEILFLAGMGEHYLEQMKVAAVIARKLEEGS